jgi:hypothetical protein
MEGYSTSVELPILTTHLHRGDSGLHEVICTKEWVELPRWKKRYDVTVVLIIVPSLSTWLEGIS